ncbi:hypothetical protein SAMN06297468_1729 [Altererythrobacter xiamenensis]|uniref:Uncharacterized protein n=1 Tax=Altererythrobacter xiamenensis TaxID=1316679 RepID=A0A1Y6FAV7_9SPHN|nr:hypothetical protein [Altererythrobacter xiamenensis]SMQ69543.1 hypothetical protein SAMN06297468_1729 [Altererythrobacter xiamenensis]
MPSRLALGAASLALLAAPLCAQDTEASADTAEVAPVAVPHRIALPVGSDVPLRTLEEVSSKTARKGDLVRLEVAEDYVIDGRVVLPRGTPAVAELTLAEKKGWMGRAGKLAARMLYLDLPAGPVRLSGELGEAGQSNAEVATVLSAFTGLGFITGKSAVIPAGTELVARLDREARIPVEAEAAPGS